MNVNHKVRGAFRAAGLAAATLVAAASCALAAQDTEVSTSAAKTGWRETVAQFAQTHFKHPAWGYSHSVRDYQLAKEMAAEDGVKVDDDILFAAAYLHDLGAFPPYAKQDIDHADVAVLEVETVLSASGFPLEKLPGVKEAIRTHMFDRKPVTPEGIYLHDADSLDWLGAVGAARVLSIVDNNGGMPTAPQAAQMLEDNMSKIPASVVSKAGKARVAARETGLKSFLEELKAETSGFATL